MKKNEVKVGGLYHAKVSDKLVTVRIDSSNTHGGWNATNTRTGKRIRIKSAQRLRGPAKGGAKTEASEAPKAAVVKDVKVEARAKDTTEKAKALKDAAPLKAKTKKDGAKQKTPKRTSALDAAAQVLAKFGEPMRAQELIAVMAEQNLWKSPGGATPWATLYAAMTREERDKGSASRFKKVDRGLFAANA